MVTIISTFAGCGGSSLGYQMAGYTELLAIEWDKNAVETFKLNFPDIPVWQRDIKEVTTKEILEFCKLEIGELDLLDGSPPCQGFSTAGKRQVVDPRNDLFKEFTRLIEGLKPKVFIMENVSGMVKGKMKGRFKEIILSLKSTGYQVKCKKLNTMWYGVPQSRERLIFIGVRNDIGIEASYPEPCNNVVSPSDLISKLKGKQFLTFRNKGGKDSVRSTDFPAPAITSRLSVKGRIDITNINTLKILQSFPSNFQWAGSTWDAKKEIGNSVPPKFMEAIANHIKKEILEKHA